jgi:drug/metabolite transporter (DMT)-like permease
MDRDSAEGTATRTRHATFWWYFLLLALTNLIWSGQGSAAKTLEQSAADGGVPWGPIAITFLPFYVTTVLFVPLLVWQQRRNPNRVRPGWHDWWKFAVAGIGGQLLAQLGMTWGIIKSLASNGAILNLLIPVITAVLASLLLRERLTALRVLCLVIGLAGVSLMSVRDLEDSSFLQQGYLVGNLLILVGCCGSSFYNVYCKGLLTRFGEVEILIFSYITASLASLPLLIWVEPFDVGSLAALDWRGWLAFGFLAVFMYGVSMLLFFYVLEHLSVTVASASLYLVPVFGVLIAYTVIGEELSKISLAGAVIVLASTVLIMRYDASVS